MSDSAKIDNAPHDEEVEVSDPESVPDQNDESDVSDGDDAPGPGVAATQSQDSSLEFGDEFESQDQGGGKKAQQVVANQPYDEAVDVSSSESVDEPQAPTKQAAPASSGASSAADAPPPAAPKAAQSDEGSEESETTSDEEDEEEGGAPQAQGYNPADYANLQVSQEVKELFQYIGRYKPQTIELETKLKPFIPEYVPAVGEIDPFLKMPRPDGKKDDLGLTVLDEPAAQQTDPTVLDLQLRAISTQAALQPTVVPSIDNAAQNPQKVSNWIQNISELHRSNPPPNVHYTKSMPDVETLMQVWAPEIEEALEGTQLPSAELCVDTKAYARIVCAILDIPVYSSLVESLHLLFTLYSEFKASNQDAMQPGLELQ